SFFPSEIAFKNPSKPVNNNSKFKDLFNPSPFLSLSNTFRKFISPFQYPPDSAISAPPAADPPDDGNPMSLQRLDPQSAAEKAVSVIGFGYDLSNDLRMSSCKPADQFGSKLVEFDPKLPARDLFVPGGIVVKNVWSGIKCDKGERTRFNSDVLSFNQMSEKFNRELNLSGKIPSGMFNSMFDFKGCWAKDAGSVKSLAFDGWFITLYNIELERSHLTLSEKVKAEVPNSWDPPALAEFIEKYGTHIVVGIKMGGKDAIHLKQLKRSNLDPTQVQKLMKQLADQRYLQDPESSPAKPKAENPLPFGMYAASIRPPVVTLLKNEVESGNRPVTGMRLHLEGKKGDHLAIHLQHLSTCPNTIQLEDDDHNHDHQIKEPERGFLEPVNWTIFSHVCTAPVQYDGARIDETASIVTKARLEVKVMGLKKVLFLRLGYSMVTTGRIRRSEWDGPSNTMSRKSGIFSTLMISTKLNPNEQEVGKADLNSAIFPGGPPLPVKAPKMSNFVETREMVRGPEDSPGYWVMSGAKLCVEEGRISIKGKYSLLAMISEEGMLFM
ncbi:MACPF domain-containing protein NSL1, partial [Linum perenne]